MHTVRALRSLRHDNHDHDFDFDFHKLDLDLVFDLVDRGNLSGLYCVGGKP